MAKRSMYRGPSARICRCPRCHADEVGTWPRPMAHDVEVPTPEIAEFGDDVSSALVGSLGRDLIGVYFVGSVALGGYVAAESDVDIAAVSWTALSDRQKRSVASAIVAVSEMC